MCSSDLLESVPPELTEARQTQRAGFSTPWRSSGGGYPTRRERLYGGAPSWKAPASTSAKPSSYDPDDNFTVDTGYDDDMPSLRKGSRVRHPSFGTGTVMELSGFGTDVKAAIEFDSVGRKMVVLKYANLEPEWE